METFYIIKSNVTDTCKCGMSLQQVSLMVQTVNSFYSKTVIFIPTVTKIKYSQFAFTRLFMTDGPV